MHFTAYTKYDDAELLALLRNNDQLAFAEIYERYRQEIYRYGLTLVKIPEIAEDLVHDVFVKIWDVRHKLEIKQTFRSYLFRVCHNRAIDINKEIAANQNLTDQLVYHYGASAQSAELTAKELEYYDHLVQEALNSLTPQRRKIYEMCKKDKKSYEEVARELNISPNTVKATIAQTLTLLRDYISKHGNISAILILLQKIL